MAAGRLRLLRCHGFHGWHIACTRLCQSADIDCLDKGFAPFTEEHEIVAAGSGQQ